MENLNFDALKEAILDFLDAVAKLFKDFLDGAIEL